MKRLITAIEVERGPHWGWRVKVRFDDGTVRGTRPMGLARAETMVSRFKAKAARKE